MDRSGSSTDGRTGDGVGTAGAGSPPVGGGVVTVAAGPEIDDGAGERWAATTGLDSTRTRLCSRATSLSSWKNTMLTGTKPTSLQM